ncbi:MAG: methyltransferase domain-containing protein, partial [Flavitalea sp.]
GHRITIQGVKKFIRRSHDQFIIAEIGCGGGDNLKAIHHWNKKRHNIKYIGVDLNEACIGFAKTNCKELNATFIHSDYSTVIFETPPDIIFSSLFCHHFSNEQLGLMLNWLVQLSVRGFFINDLQRNRLAFHSIGLLTNLFSKSYLVKNDAPISVLRGFIRKEWDGLFLKAGINQYSIDWKWAFRYLITVGHEQ